MAEVCARGKVRGVSSITAYARCTSEGQGERSHAGPMHFPCIQGSCDPASSCVAAVRCGWQWHCVLVCMLVVVAERTSECEQHRYAVKFGRNPCKEESTGYKGVQSCVSFRLLQPGWPSEVYMCECGTCIICRCRECSRWDVDIALCTQKSGPFRGNPRQLSSDIDCNDHAFCYQRSRKCAVPRYSPTFSLLVHT